MNVQSLMIAAIGLFTPPIPLYPDQWVDAKAMKSSVVRESSASVVDYSLVVSPKGQPISCNITSSAISPELASLTCKMLISRARFRPAINSIGNPAYSVYRSWIFWKAADLSEPPYFDIIVYVNHAWSKDVGSVLLMVDLAVDAHGGISGCQAEPDQGFENLDDIACQQVRDHWPSKSVLDEAGNAIPSLQVIKVGFAPEPNSK